LFSSKELWSSLEESIDLTLVYQFVKGLLQLSTFSHGMFTLFTELTILLGILLFRGHGHRRRAPRHRMPSNLHDNAPSIRGKLGVHRLELQPPFPGAGIPVAVIEVLIP